jgi:hypothetical protein
MLSMTDTQKRFSIQLDLDSFAVLRAVALTEGVPPAVLAREAILDRLRAATAGEREEKLAMAMQLAGDGRELHLPAPGKGSAQLQAAGAQ